MKRKSLLVLLGVAIAAQLLLLPFIPIVLNVAGLFVFAALCPGLLLVELLIGRDSLRPQPLERIVFAITAGYGIVTFILLLLSYVPGPLAAWHLLLAFNLLLAGLAYGVWRRSGHALSVTAAFSFYPPLSQRRLIFAVGSILVVGGLLRLPSLGYSEFQGDEARAVLRAAAVIQGFDETLMLHKKGPVEILLPTAGYALSSRVTEAAARLPFAVANLTALLGLFLLGWALFGPVAGWCAAMLLAVEGYLIGFSRIVQYQSIVVLMTVMTILILYRLVRAGRAAAGYLILAALFAVTGLLAHYEAMTIVLPGVYLLWLLIHHSRDGDSPWRPLALAMLIGGVLLALFYIPYLFHPNFTDTYFYLTQYRIGDRPPYNHLNDFVRRTILYDSTYHFVAMAGLLLLALMQAYWHGLKAPWRWLALTLIVLSVMAAVAIGPDLLIGQGIDLSGVLVSLAFVVAILLPRQSDEERLLWLWFGPLLIVALFLIAKPRTHVYVFFAPAALLAGMVLLRGWDWLVSAVRAPWATVAGVAIATAGILLFGVYTFQLFTYTGVEVYRTWADNRPRGYWTPFDQPAATSLFGLPARNGWKALGVLYAADELSGAYETNDFDRWVTHWYTRGAERCWRDHHQLAIGDHSEPKRQDETTALLESIRADHVPGYTITVKERPRLDIYLRESLPAGEAQILPIESIERRFDRELSNPMLPLDAPIISPRYSEQLDYRLGDNILLAGYRLDSHVVQPGGTLELTLYWHSLGEIEEAYTVFNQLIGPENAMYGQIDAQPGCDLDPTNGWPADGYVIDRYHVPVFENVPPGVYPLFTGMYDHNHDRLPVFGPDGDAFGEAVFLGDVTVEAAAP